MTPEQKIVLLHRKVFVESEDGQELLAYLLGDMAVFDDDLKEEGEVAVANYGRRILKHCGIIDTLDKGKRDNQLKENVRLFSSIPFKEKKND